LLIFGLMPRGFHRWPNSFCKVTHIVDGKVTELWIKVDSPLKGWRGHEVASLIESETSADKLAATMATSATH